MILKALWKTLEQSGGMKDSARIRRQSQRSARALKYMQHSGVYDRGGLATEKILDELVKFERTENAVPILSFNGRMMWDSTDMPIHIVGLPGAMKTTALGLPMAALWSQSLFVIDVDLEYCRATWRHRREELGNLIHFVIPSERYGFISSAWNLFQPIIDAAQCGNLDLARNLAWQAAHILIPTNPEGRTGDNDWVPKSGRRLLAMALLFLATDRPEECIPASLYSLFMLPVPKLLRAVGETSLPEVLEVFLKLQAEYAAGAYKQVEWRLEAAADALSLFAPGSRYARATSRSDFDPASLKNAKAPQTIYLGIEGDELVGAGKFVSLFLNMAIERIAAASGDWMTLFLCDEVARTPKASGVTKGIQTNRKRKQKFVTVTQSPNTMDENWGEKARKNVEEMAGTTVWFSPPLEVARALEAKSGTRTAVFHGAKDGESGHVGKSLSEASVPNLHVSEICFPKDGKVFVEMRGVPGIIVADAVPWWEIHPLSEQIDPGYRDDFYVYDGPPPISLEDAKALFGVSDDYLTVELDAREGMLNERFDPALVRSAREILERS